MAFAASYGFEVLERLAASDAAIHRLARCRTERGQALGVLAAAAWADNRIRLAAEDANGHGTVRRCGSRGSDAVFEKLATTLGADPVGGPSRCALQGDVGWAEAGILDGGEHVVLDDLRRRAAGIGR